MPKLGRRGVYIGVRLGLGGFWRGFGPSDLDLAAPDARGGMLDLGGCEEELGPEERREVQPGGSFGDRNVRRRYRQRYHYMSKGWADKRTPNATKLGRRSVYTIIRPHDKLQPIPRTFLCHL